LVAGKTLTATWNKKDSNGRIIGWVIVQTGYAWWFERYSPDEEQLREAQEAARSAKRGLWAEAMAVDRGSGERV